MNIYLKYVLIWTFITIEIVKFLNFWWLYFKQISRPLQFSVHSNFMFLIMCFEHKSESNLKQA